MASCLLGEGHVPLFKPVLGGRAAGCLAEGSGFKLHHAKFLPWPKMCIKYIKDMSLIIEWPYQLLKPTTMVSGVSKLMLADSQVYCSYDCCFL